MVTTLSLLAMPVNDASRAIVGELLKSGVDGSQLEVGVPQASHDLDLSIPVDVPMALVDDPQWPYEGSVRVGYNKLALGNFFNGVDLSLEVTETVTASWIANLLSTVFDVRLDTGDYIEASYAYQAGSQRVTFTAGPNSTRWKGYVEIELIGVAQ